MHEILVMTGPDAKTADPVLATEFIVGLSDQDQRQLRVIRANINSWHGPGVGHPNSGESAERFLSRLCIALIELDSSPSLAMSPEHSFVQDLAGRVSPVKVRLPNVPIDKATAESYGEARTELLRLFDLHGLGHKYVIRVTSSMTIDPSWAKVTHAGKTEAEDYAPGLRDTTFASLEAAFKKFVWLRFATLTKVDILDIPDQTAPLLTPLTGDACVRNIGLGRRESP